MECRGKAPLVHTSVGKLVELWTDGVQVSQNKRSTAVQPMADVTSRQWLQHEGTLVGAVKHVDTTGMCTNRSPRPLRVAKYTAHDIMTVQIIIVASNLCMHIITCTDDHFSMACMHRHCTHRLASIAVTHQLTRLNRWYEEIVLSDHGTPGKFVAWNV